MSALPTVRSPWRIAILIVCFFFLYAPMVLLVVYSFNSSQLAAWESFSLHWYNVLFHDGAMTFQKNTDGDVDGAPISPAKVLSAPVAPGSRTPGMR